MKDYQWCLKWTAVQNIDTFKKNGYLQMLQNYLKKISMGLSEALLDKKTL
jgi:hypothetical protein